MEKPTLSPAALDALTLLAQKPGSPIDLAAYRELAEHDFVMAAPEKAHITQRGKTFYLERKSTEGT